MKHNNFISYRISLSMANNHIKRAKIDTIDQSDELDMTNHICLPYGHEKFLSYKKVVQFASIFSFWHTLFLFLLYNRSYFENPVSISALRWGLSINLSFYVLNPAHIHTSLYNWKLSRSSPACIIYLLELWGKDLKMKSRLSS